MAAVLDGVTQGHTSESIPEAASNGNGGSDSLCPPSHGGPKDAEHVLLSPCGLMQQPAGGRGLEEAPVLNIHLPGQQGLRAPVTGSVLSQLQQGACRPVTGGGQERDFPWHR